METDSQTQFSSNGERGPRDGLQTSLASFKTGTRCALCNNFERRLLRGYLRQHRAAFDSSPADLHRSALRCPFCAILVAAIQQFEPEVASSSSPISWIYARGPAEDPPCTLSLEIYFSGPRCKLELELYASSPCGLPAIDQVIRRNERVFQPTEPMSETSLSWVRNRLGECLQAHGKCSKTKEAELPPRVLSLTVAGPGAIKIALQETSGSRGTYACLSHRWGGSELGIATRDQYPKLLCGISWSSLPQTFQDAVRFTVALGVSYLWIDSLCIIQDDPEDWRTQAGLMAGIYQNSFVTLAATSSPGSDHGCFWMSSDSFERTFETEAGPFSVRKVIRHWERLWTSNSAAVFPLMTRAWVFQERLLASRVIHFSHHELVWECNQAGACQCNGYRPESNSKLHSWTGAEAWSNAIELYTSLHLTNEQDRLTALLGFARWYGQSTGQAIERNYLVGLWKASLHSDLMWRVDADSLGVSRRSGSPKLCRCLDSNRSEDRPPRCQYSFSAACSPHCLAERRLCRYGLEAAAVPWSAQFRGACPGQGDKWSTIAELRRVYKADGRSALDSRPNPSWSWVSAGTGVKYWSDIRHVPRPPATGRSYVSPCELENAKIRHDGGGLAGPVSEAWLRLNGWVAYPRLQYRYQPDPADPGVRNHSIFRYGLTFGGVGGKELEFYPDYILCLEGERWMPEGTPLFTFHVSRGVHLVLQVKAYFSFDEANKWRLALNRETARERMLSTLTRSDSERKFVRIGILRSPGSEPDTTYWETEWLAGLVIE